MVGRGGWTVQRDAKCLDFKYNLYNILNKPFILQIYIIDYVCNLPHCKFNDTAGFILSHAHITVI